MAVHDFPAHVTYVKNFTKFDKIIYMGHSQGTFQYFLSYTMKPEFIEKNIEKFVAIGTVFTIFNTVLLSFIKL